jgi:alkyl sulfatase BDS1-like metallo-beta-lactamase superfamily hydrolase
MNSNFTVVLVLTALIPLHLVGCEHESSPTSVNVKAERSLTEHTKEFFPPRLIEVTDGVYSAVGFGLANSILVEGDDGAIIIDTMETIEEGHMVREEFRKVSSKPIKAIIYTHNHTDHVFGAEAFVDAGQSPEVFAQERTMDYVYRIVSEYRPIITKRSFRMFGTYLDRQAMINDGIGPFLGIDEDSTLGIVKPTRTFSDYLEAEIAGVRFRLVHAPGETDDQIFVWFPDKRVLACGDNLYKAFPNLYTIRGTPYRDLKGWVASLDKMRALNPEHLVPSHTRPISGQAKVNKILTDYRDAIQYVHDQTVRGINQGLTPDELVETVKLPPHLAASPYLQEFYGKTSWSVRSVFSGNLGWFDGNPSTLDPLSPDVKAAKMVGLAGGIDKLRDALVQAQSDGEHKWALELSDFALRINPGDDKAKQVRISALLALGEAESNPNARHYYLTTALELDGKIDIQEYDNASDDMMKVLPTRRFFDSLAVNLNSQASLNLDKKIGFTFPDSDEQYTVWVRRGVAEIMEGLDTGLDIHVVVDSLAWKKLLARKSNTAVALARDFEFKKGRRIGFIRFLALFRPDTP